MFVFRGRRGDKVTATRVAAVGRDALRLRFRLRVTRGFGWLPGSTAIRPRYCDLAHDGPGSGAARSWACGTAQEMAGDGVRRPRLKDVGDFGVHGDASGFDFADDVREQISGRVVLVDGESSGISSALRAQRDVFTDVPRADHVAIQV